MIKINSLKLCMNRLYFTKTEFFLWLNQMFSLIEYCHENFVAEFCGNLVGCVLQHSNFCRIFNAKSCYISSEVGDCSRGRSEGSLFNSYYTEV